MTAVFHAGTTVTLALDAHIETVTLIDVGGGLITGPYNNPGNLVVAGANRTIGRVQLNTQGLIQNFEAPVGAVARQFLPGNPPTIDGPHQDTYSRGFFVLIHDARGANQAIYWKVDEAA